MQSKLKNKPTKKFNWRGFTLQLFVITIIPLTALLLIVAFGSQSLHREAMRNLVGDRDLRTARAAASSIEQEIDRSINFMDLLSRSVDTQTNFYSFIFKPEEIDSIFDGGLALFTQDGYFIKSSNTRIDWQNISLQSLKSFNTPENEFSLSVVLGQPVTSKNSKPYLLITTVIENQEILIGAFSANRLIKTAIGDLVQTTQTSTIVISPGETDDTYEILFQTGNLPFENKGTLHPGIKDSLSGESGINYYQGEAGEHVIAFAPIPSAGWGLVSEEAWENIASPYLNTTQYAPLTIVPVFLLTLMAVWFGARRIVQPLQKLEKQASNLANGDFSEIQIPVGGIEEIRNLQLELIEMAAKLKAAQQNLHSYIGDITEGIENERRSLAREIHDDTIQSLIALNQRIQLIMMKAAEPQKKDLQELLTMMKQTMENLRRMVRGLRPIYLEDLGLSASLEMLVNEMEQAAKIPINFELHGVERRLDPNTEMLLYRIVQESLNNVIHHAVASHSWVELEFSETELCIRIRDDGKGFVVPANPSNLAKQGHFGLVGMKERAEIINADFRISASPNNGTVITIKILK
jgi:signal transduction histidine kinase